ncbi:MAG TPA: hypothetical protein VEQ35_04930 [Beijerinckia sp.]|nr:hypothetical protein [Beijerinckia sp.]
MILPAEASKSSADAGLPATQEGAGASFTHATAIVIGESGILIRGASGSGKSRLALALLDLAARSSCFGRLIGDDRVSLEPRGGRLIVRGHPLIAGQIEQRGVGILTIPCLDSGVVRLVVDLKAEIPPRYPEPADRETLLAGVKLPLLTLRQGVASCDMALTIWTRLYQPS